MASDLGGPADHGGPPRRRLSRRGRILAWTSAIVTAVIAAAATGGYLGYRHLSANIHIRNIGHLVGPQPADLRPAAENILVIGSDSCTGSGERYCNPQVDNIALSDTLMIVHIPASRQWAEVVSIPRDSWVHIPSCDMGNGQRSSPADFKINEAFALGSLYGDQATGAACTIRTIEQDTGLRIDHFVVINYAGFTGMVNALGGVEVCTRRPIADPGAKLFLPAGHHMLTGGRALAYVRARYTLGDGSDLGRITREQAFMSSLVNRAKSELYNPIAIYRFLDAATESVTIDSGLGGIPGLYGLASALKNLPARKLTFITVPTYPRSRIDPADTANVMWQQPQAGGIFSALREDLPWQREPGQGRAAARRVSPASAASGGAAGTASPQPSGAGTGRTANQNICT